MLMGLGGKRTIAPLQIPLCDKSSRKTGFQAYVAKLVNSSLLKTKCYYSPRFYGAGSLWVLASKNVVFDNKELTHTEDH